MLKSLKTERQVSAMSMRGMEMRLERASLTIQRALSSCKEAEARRAAESASSAPGQGALYQKLEATMPRETLSYTWSHDAATRIAATGSQNRRDCEATI